MDDILAGSATDAADLLRRKLISSRELTELLLDRIDRPTNFTPAFPHDSRPFDERTIATPEGERRYDEQPFWISHASLAGPPAVAAPIGTTPSGLPIGAQIIGPLYEDDRDHVRRTARGRSRWVPVAARLTAGKPHDAAQSTGPWNRQNGWPTMTRTCSRG